MRTRSGLRIGRLAATMVAASSISTQPMTGARVYSASVGTYEKRRAKR